MKRTYVSLIALVALFAVSQAQAMQNDEGVQLLMDKAEGKYAAELQAARAQNNFAAIDVASKKLIRVQNQILKLQQAVKAYKEGVEANKSNPNFNPMTSEFMARLIKAQNEAVQAYTSAYGELTK